MITTIFLGPSLPRSEAERILPAALYRPPAEQGDLLTAVHDHGAEIIGLIDGTFHQNLSVWHNEVCYVLSRGVAVFGASSMGALRAVETERFGMVGVGNVFRWYRDGVITADDEVALRHGDESVGYRSLSLPLVNIRASMDSAAKRGLINKPIAAEVIEVAQALYYPDRVVRAILQGCRERNVTDKEIRAIESALTTYYVDVKRADACEALNAIRRLRDGTDAKPPRVPFAFARSSVFEALYNRDRLVHTEDGECTLESIGEYVALHDPECESIRRAALNREVVTYFGLLLGLRVTPEELAKQRAEFLLTRGLGSDDSLKTWLRVNAMSDADLTEYLAAEALCARLRRWIVEIHMFDRSLRPVLNEHRFRGTFPQWAAATAEEAAIVAAYHEQPSYSHLTEEDPARLAEQHALHTGIAIVGDAGKWAEEAGFGDVTELAEALRRSAIAHDVKSRIARQLEAIKKLAGTSGTRRVASLRANRARSGKRKRSIRARSD